MGYPKWNESADVWSVACIVMETFLGDPMFATHDSEEHLALMVRALGPIPRKMRSRCEYSYVVFERWCSSNFLAIHVIFL